MPSTAPIKLATVNEITMPLLTHSVSNIVGQKWEDHRAMVERNVVTIARLIIPFLMAVSLERYFHAMIADAPQVMAVEMVKM